MIWILAAVIGFGVWLSVALLFLSLCRAAARADEIAEGRRVGDRPRAAADLAVERPGVSALR